MADVPAALTPYQRSSWRPVMAADEGDRAASKIAGRPWLAAGEAWLCCPNCGEPLPLLLQLNRRDLPEPHRASSGLVQLFYCPNSDCETACEAYFPFAASVLVRQIAPEGPPAEVELRAGWPGRAIATWHEQPDYPNQEELEELGVALSADDTQFFEELETLYPRSGDKLGGWPRWVQGVEYPNCPLCAEPMQLLFQLDSEDNLPFMFGDVGCAHLTQCPQHPEQLALGWACS